MPLKAVCVKVPGTCGEWIQTVEPSTQKECLVSLPIDLYSGYKVKLKDGIGDKSCLMRKGRMALAKIQEAYNMPETWTQRLEFEKCIDELAIGKGMASSTADILCVMAGAALLYTGKLPSDEELLALSCEIEPSDGTMFKECTLIDHLRGEIISKLGELPKLDILLMLPREAYETEKLRANENYKTLLNQKTKGPITLFRQGLDTQNIELMGRASTCSLLENEHILKKHALMELVEISKQYDCDGVVGGHSGTVAGLILNERSNVDKILEILSDKKMNEYYNDIRIVKTTAGGIAWSFVEA